MAISTAAKEFSIVLLGDFNPAILQPFWFSLNGLIRSSEATDANVQIIHKETAAWSIDWFRLVSNDERLQITTELEAYFEPLRDLAVGALILLEHTPIKAVGLNFGGHFQLADQASYDRFGHEIAPKSRWRSVSRAKTQRLVITGARADELPGVRNVTVSATNKYPYCVHVHANEHAEVPGGTGEKPASWVARHIADNYAPAQGRFEEVQTELFEGF
ncbi:MAG: hypothetical protein R3F18_02850 [Lysobacterales bacterium]